MIVVFHADLFALNGEKVLMIKGSIGVEFFFLVSGYLMARTALNKKDLKDYSELGSETWAYVWKKIKHFFPYILVCHVIGLITKTIYSTMIIQDYVLSLLDLLLVRMAGFKLVVINGVTWYISAMLITMLFLYPLIRKYKKNFIYLVCPLLVLLIGGWISKNYTTIRTPALWTGFAYKGLLRAIVELSLGSILYVLTEKVKQIDFTKIGKIFITIIEIIGFLIPFFVSQFLVKGSKYDFIMIIFLSISIIFAFSEKTCEYKLFNNKLFYHLEKLSLPLFLSHVTLRSFVNEFYLFESFNYYQKLLIFLFISILISELMLYVIEKLRNKKFYLNHLKNFIVKT